MDLPASPPHEIELKLSLEPGMFARVRKHPALAPLLAGRAHTSALISRYYDTPTRRLHDAGVTLRLRRAGRRWLQTAKGSGSADCTSASSTNGRWRGRNSTAPCWRRRRGKKISPRPST
jgi:CYTH domain